MKTTIARYLIDEYTAEGDVVLDPFCGSGVIPLEAALSGRGVVAGDTNPYGVLLTKAKLYGPSSEGDALEALQAADAAAKRRLDAQDLRSVPSWVRKFFHRETLRNALALRDELAARNDWFLLACLLGILHHQRPGFLSFPSSHLVPYLRDRKFPRQVFPSLYEERDVYSRLEAKVRRTFRRPPASRSSEARVFLSDSARIPVSGGCAKAIITSPPYMNELDYIRDNRLRLWFLRRELPLRPDILKSGRENHFKRLVARTLRALVPRLSPSSAIVLVVGDASRGKDRADSAAIVRQLFDQEAALSEFRLARAIDDAIPDIRRSRRDLSGTKREVVLSFVRSGSPTRQ